MNIRVLTADQLTPELVAAWSACQCENPALDSPHFRPEFTAAVAAVRNDVEIAVLEEGTPVGFFPFHRVKDRVGVPVGGRLSDFQGLIACQGLSWNVEALMEGCGLRVWRFNHLISQPSFAPYCFAAEVSPYMDLSAGVEAYNAGRQARGSDEPSRTRRKLRKLERDIGPLRFEAHASDPSVFAQLIDWKRSQYHRTGETDVFSYPWTLALLERILEERGDAFAGMLSALYAGDRLAAAHLGMRSYGVLHAWFPVYNHEMAAYSPGLILFAELAKNAQSLGIRRIDLAKGMTRMKQELMSASTQVSEGCFSRSRLAPLLRRAWSRTRQKLHTTPLRAVLRFPARIVRRLRDHLEFR